jgi:hypothetical protein
MVPFTADGGIYTASAGTSSLAHRKSRSFAFIIGGGKAQAQGMHLLL